MKRLINRLSQMQLTWPFIAICAVVLILVFVLMSNGTQKELQQTRSTLSEKQVASIGTDRYIENAALSEGMQDAGSIRFNIINYEDLEKYTEQEWKSIMEDLEWAGV